MPTRMPRNVLPNGPPYARRRAESLGGRLTLDSEIGRGTEVPVEIPASPGRSAAEAAHVAATGRTRPVAGSFVVVDDEAFVAAVRPLLGEVAGSVTFLRDGSHAAATVGRERPNAALLGLNMPGVDSYEVYRLPTAHPATARTPVVVLTALDAATTSPSRCPAATSGTWAAATAR
ncbi:hypothetical protein [Streptomyces sp. SCL15-4]|uniref:response regulator n=1 Tax=Streptomyces sp. SCL15-4 TaxID=2967221 RepID=UPI002966931F|nr:hypothetical protein [Streptomyces sp. SCL15-4]